MLEPLSLGATIQGGNLDHPTSCWRRFPEYQREADMKVTNNLIHFRNNTITNDEWDYLFIPNDRFSARNYSWKMDFLRNTTFREYAFNFRYQDFDNRYRFRFEADKLFFDKKVAGQWVNNIASIPFIMKLEHWYRLRIDVFESLFRCYVDGTLLLEASDTDLSNGSICIILWEDDGSTRIDAVIRAQQANLLVRES